MKAVAVLLAVGAMSCFGLPASAKTYEVDSVSEKDFKSGLSVDYTSYSTGVNQNTGETHLGMDTKTASGLQTVTVGINATHAYLPDGKIVLVQESSVPSNENYNTYVGRFNTLEKTESERIGIITNQGKVSKAFNGTLSEDSAMSADGTEFTGTYTAEDGKVYRIVGKRGAKQPNGLYAWTTTITDQYGNSHTTSSINYMSIENPPADVTNVYTVTAKYEGGEWATSIVDQNGNAPTDPKMTTITGPVENKELDMNIGKVDKKADGYFMTNTIKTTGQITGTVDEKTATVKTGDVVSASVSENGNELTISVNGEETTFSPVHYYSVNDGGTPQSNYDNMGATGTNATAAGVAASAKGTNATAVGAQANAAGNNAVALGVAAQATQENAVAIGVQSNAAATHAIAIGTASKALQNNALAIGSEANASGANTMALGTTAQATQENAIAIGVGANAAGQNAMALGVTASAAKQAAVAVGVASQAQGLGSSAFGTEAKALGDHSVAYGASTSAEGLASTALGTAAKTTVGNATSVGAESQVNALGGVALGWNSIASTVAGETGVDLTGEDHSNDKSGIWKSTYGAVSIGGGEFKDGRLITRQITNVAAGTQETDAVNVAQLKSAKTHYYGVNDGGEQQDNYNGEGAVGKNALAAGVKAKAEGESSIAIGSRNTVYGGQSVAIGTGHVIAANRSGAIGDPAYITGDDSYAIGNSNNISAPQGFVLGNNSTVSGQGGIVAGSSSKVTAKDSVAIGNNAVADKENSVALGSGSKTGEVVGTSEIEIPGSGKKYSNISGTKPVGTVSVGDKGQERTITNVAAGRVGPGSTDAINGSQLYAVTEQVGQNTQRIGNLERRIGAVRQDANAGVAMALAAASLPQAYLPGKSMMAMAAGTYLGEQGYAIGFSSVSDDGKWIFKANASGNSQGHYGAAVGAGYQW